MTACPRCDARYSGTPETERKWIERHIARHGHTRRAFGPGVPADSRKLSSAA